MRPHGAIAPTVASARTPGTLEHVYHPLIPMHAAQNHPKTSFLGHESCFFRLRPCADSQREVRGHLAGGRAGGRALRQPAPAADDQAMQLRRDPVPRGSGAMSGLSGRCRNKA